MNPYSKLTLQNAHVDTLFVTYASQDILNYSAHAVLVNSIFFEHQKRAHIYLDEQSGDVFDHEDKRWNKVIGMADALTGWAHDVSSIVVMDADLTILNLNFQVQQYLQSFPRASIIMSADALDTANTGIMIIRNNVWSKWFFRHWRSLRTSHPHLCDQHALNLFLESVRRNATSADQRFAALLSHRLVVLPADEINSRFPPAESYSSSSQVLHLLGQSNALRGRVFQDMTCKLCRLIAHDTTTPDSIMSISGEFQYPVDSFTQSWTPLVNYLLRDVSGERNSYWSIMSATSLQHHASQLVQASFLEAKELFESDPSNNAHLKAFVDVADAYCQFHRQMELTTNVVSKCLNSYQQVVSVHVRALQDETEKFDGNPSAALHIMSQIAMSRLRIMWFLGDWCDMMPGEASCEGLVQAGFSNATQALHDLQTVATASNLDIDLFIAHKTGSLFRWMMEWEHRRGRYNLASSYGFRAVDSLGSLLNDGRLKTSDFSGVAMEYIGATSSLSQVLFLQGSAVDALVWAQSSVSSLEYLMTRDVGERRYMIDLLVSAYKFAIEICRQLNDSIHLVMASRYEEKLFELFQTHNYIQLST